MRVELTNGKYAEIRDFDAEPLNNRERTRILRCLSMDPNDPKVSLGDFWVFVMALAREGVKEWDVGLPLPSETKGTADPLESSLGDLSAEDANVIGEAVQPYVNKLVPDFSLSVDPNSPTQPSGASATP